MTLWRAQVVLKHVSGLPRDHATNTFWMNDEGGPTNEIVAETVAENVRDFYTQVAAGADATVGSYLSPSIVNTGHEIKVAPVVVATGVDERGEGFPPVWNESFDFIGRTLPPDGAPAEVAVALSYKNMASGAVPPARRRGRIFIGPLSQQPLDLVTQTVRPLTTMRNNILAAAVALHARAEADGHEWVIYSRPYEGRDEVPRPGNPRGPLPALPARAGALYPITDFWVDNSFDTIRKRGEKPTSRVTAVA